MSPSGKPDVRGPSKTVWLPWLGIRARLGEKIPAHLRHYFDALGINDYRGSLGWVRPLSIGESVHQVVVLGGGRMEILAATVLAKFLVARQPDCRLRLILPVSAAATVHLSNVHQTLFGCGFSDLMFFSPEGALNDQVRNCLIDDLSSSLLALPFTVQALQMSGAESPEILPLGDYEATEEPAVNSLRGFATWFEQTYDVGDKPRDPRRTYSISLIRTGSTGNLCFAVGGRERRWFVKVLRRSNWRQAAYGSGGSSDEKLSETVRKEATLVRLLEERSGFPALLRTRSDEETARFVENPVFAASFIRLGRFGRSRHGLNEFARLLAGVHRSLEVANVGGASALSDKINMIRKYASPDGLAELDSPGLSRLLMPNLWLAHIAVDAGRRALRESRFPIHGDICEGNVGRATNGAMVLIDFHDYKVEPLEEELSRVLLRFVFAGRPFIGFDRRMKDAEAFLETYAATSGHSIRRDLVYGLTILNFLFDLIAAAHYAKHSEVRGPIQSFRGGLTRTITRLGSALEQARLAER